MAEYGVVNDLVLIALIAFVTLGSINYGYLLGSVDSKKKYYVSFSLIFSALGYTLFAMNTGDMAADSIPFILFAIIFTMTFCISSKHHDRLVVLIQNRKRFKIFQ